MGVMVTWAAGLLTSGYDIPLEVNSSCIGGRQAAHPAKRGGRQYTYRSGLIEDALEAVRQLVGTF